MHSQENTCYIVSPDSGGLINLRIDGVEYNTIMGKIQEVFQKPPGELEAEYVKATQTYNTRINALPMPSQDASDEDWDRYTEDVNKIKLPEPPKPVGVPEDFVMVIAADKVRIDNRQAQEEITFRVSGSAAAKKFLEEHMGMVF